LGIGDWGLGPIPNPQSPIPIFYPIYIISFFYCNKLKRKIMLKAFSKNFCSNASLGKEGGIQLKRNNQHKLVRNPTDNTKFTLEKNKEIDMSPYIYNKPKGLQNYQEIFKTKYDAVIIGAGHNGLVCANYLAQSGQKVLVLEKRHVVGGCAVTEELVEGYKLSRCSYVLSLFRKKNN
jgi:hypothetical protein